MRTRPHVAMLLLVLAGGTSCSSSSFVGFGVQSHFIYPNANTSLIEFSEGSAARSVVFGKLVRTNDMERAAIDSALAGYGPGHVLVNYRLNEHRTDFLMFHRLRVVASGQVVAIRELGRQETKERAVSPVLAPARVAPAPTTPRRRIR